MAISGPSALNFLEENLERLSTLPQDIRRCMELVKELDRQWKTKLSDLKAAQRAYLEHVRQKATGLPRDGSVDLREATADPAAMEEIVSLRRECTLLSEEKVAVALQALEMVEAHIVRVDRDTNDVRRDLEEKGLIQPEGEGGEGDYGDEGGYGGGYGQPAHTGYGGAAAYEEPAQAARAGGGGGGGGGYGRQPGGGGLGGFPGGGMAGAANSAAMAAALAAAAAATKAATAPKKSGGSGFDPNAMLSAAAAAASAAGGGGLLRNLSVPGGLAGVAGAAQLASQFAGLATGNPQMNAALASQVAMFAAAGAGAAGGGMGGGGMAGAGAGGVSSLGRPGGGMGGGGAAGMAAAAGLPAFDVAQLHQQQAALYAQQAAATAAQQAAAAGAAAGGERPGNPAYCVCGGAFPDDDNMIGCDNNNCAREWFHMQCVGVTEVPEGKWFCPTCTAAMRSGAPPRKKR